MNKAQKCAWFNLIITLFILGLHVSAFTIIAHNGAIPRKLNVAGFGAIFILICLSAISYQRKNRPSEAELDEHDRFINKRVLAIDCFLLWVILISACVIAWLKIGPEGTIRVYALVVLLYTVFIVAMLVHALTTLMLYGLLQKGIKEDSHE